MTSVHKSQFMHLMWLGCSCEFKSNSSIVNKRWIQSRCFSFLFAISLKSHELMTCFLGPHTEFSQAQRRSCRFVIFHQRSIMLIKGMGWEEGPLQLRIHARCQDNLIEPLKTKRRPEGSLSITGLTADDKWHSNLWLKAQTGGFRAASPCANDKTRRIKELKDTKRVFLWITTNGK